jgi:Flp pilus assembly protein TadG
MSQQRRVPRFGRPLVGARPAPSPRRMRARRGNYAILAGVTLTAMLGMAALAVDTALIHYAKIQSQAVADAGAHAALVMLRETGNIEASRDFAMNVVSANRLLGARAVVEDEDIVFGTWDYDTRAFDADGEWTNSVQVTVRKTSDSDNGPVATLFMRLFGVQYNEVQATAPAIGALRFREIIVVQDVTGSFADEIDLARDADLALLDYLAENPQPGDRIGMVTFVGAAEVWTELLHVEEDYGAIRADWNDMDWCDRSYWPWYSYAPPIFHSAPQMMGCNSGSDPATFYYDSGTNQGSGIEAALEVLVDEDLTDSHALKTIIIVSDGEPTCIPSSDVACNNAVALEGYNAADYAEDEGISIYSVSYNQSYDPDQSAYMEALVRGYGRFYETPDAEELPGILEEIASSIPISLVQ